MTRSVISYAEAEIFDAELFFYDHDLTTMDLEKTCKQYHCLYCQYLTKRDEPSSSQYLFVCDHCGWWQLITGSGGFGFKSCKTHRGCLKKYPVDSLDVPLADLRAYLRHHPTDVAHVNPTAFERLMGDCLKDKYGPCEVLHVGGTADRGIDLILIKSDEESYLIQVKRRSNLKSSESVRVVRELNGVLFRENIAKGMVITTASHFTKAALDETTVWTPTGQSYDMQLLTYRDVIDLFNIEPSNPYQPWFQYIEND